MKNPGIQENIKDAVFCTPDFSPIYEKISR